jgi:hypothetical protein
MRRLVALLALIAALAFPVSVSAYPGESRNETAVFGGPHCHTVLGVADRLAYPSHRAHDAQIRLGPAGTIFGGVAEANC